MPFINFSSQKRLIEIWKKFRILIVVYLTLIAFWIFLIVFIDWKDPTKTDEKFGFYKGFITSWFPSFTEDLFFFGPTFIGLFISTKLLRNESFETRISALTNGINMNREVEEYFKEQVAKLLSYNVQCSTIIRIKKIDKEQKNAFVEVEMQGTTVNMCEDQKVPAQINASVEPGSKIDGQFGQVYFVTVALKLAKSVLKKKNYNLSPLNIVKPGSPIDLNDLEGKPFEAKHPFFIHEDFYT